MLQKICNAMSVASFVMSLMVVTAGGEPTMNLNDTPASTTNTADDLDINSDGFTIPTSSSNIGYAGNHIFYAHA